MKRAACCEFYSGERRKIDEEEKESHLRWAPTHYIAHLLRRGMKQGKQRRGASAGCCCCSVRGAARVN